MRSNRMLVIAAFTLCFVAGGATMYAASELPLPRRAPTTVALPEAFSGLDLSEDQARLLAGVFEKYQPRTDTLILSLLPRLAALTDSMDAEIASLLTPEQRRKFESGRQGPVYLLRRKTPAGVTTDTLRPR